MATAIGVKQPRICLIPSAELVRWIAKQVMTRGSGISQYHMRVFLLVCYEANRGPGCALSNKSIGQVLGISPSTVTRCVKHFCDRGLMFNVRRRYKSAVRWPMDPFDLRQQQILEDLEYLAKDHVPNDLVGRKKWLHSQTFRFGKSAFRRFGLAKQIRADLP